MRTDVIGIVLFILCMFCRKILKCIPFLVAWPFLLVHCCKYIAVPLISSQPAQSSQCGRRKKGKQYFMVMTINK